MNTAIYEAIGLAWVLFAVCAFTFLVLYMAFLGTRQFVDDARTNAAYRVADSEFKQLQRTYGE